MMPRKYIRKKEQSYTIESLQKAVEEIKDQKITFRQAEEKYGIPRATLFDQVKKGRVSTLPKRVDQDKFKGTFESFGDIITSETPIDTSHVGPDHDNQREFHSESQISDAANNSIPSEVRSQQESQPSSNVNIINESVPNVPDQDEINENNAISEADLNQSTTSQTSQSSSVPLSDLLKVPTLQIHRSKRAVNKKHSIIFTSTPEKKNLEEKEQKKVDKKRKAQEKENKTTSNKLKKKSTVIHPPKTGLCVQSVISGLMRTALQEYLLKALLVIFVVDVDLVRKYPMLSVINPGSVRIYPERYGSDSECEYSTTSISTGQKAKSCRKPSAESNGKRKIQSHTTSARASKKTNTDSDIFGISKNRNIPNKEHSLDHLTSFIVNRVASGCERRATTTDGEFYIDCKVYKTEDARLTDSAELWKKALIRMKFQTDVDSLQWRKLQELVQATDILFPDKPMFYDN
ncbi:hypothetical protein HW555_012455 [Spodoptera exigua]|uniref:HTH psq-type domain-containing protein n=1 Tax=Spodoptera exigua TaxID=7107 RepID=A0A835G4Y0_SPOEX|nr:hypothetical protein HW555_012455 [Spodoptera exigua]